MNVPVQLASGVREEVRQAARWYADRDRNAAARFVAAVDRAIERAAQWPPDAGSIIEGVAASVPVRRVPVGRFPYQLVYAHANEAIFVLAVAHHHRRPGYWTARLQP